MSRLLREVVIDVNDVTKRDKFGSVAGGAKHPGLGVRPCPGRLDWADQPDGPVVQLPQSSVRSEGPHRAAYGIVAAVAVPVSPGAPL